MYSPPLQPLCNPQSYVSGDVTIDPSAVIGSGVLLAAEPNSRIVIAAGVCIGMGTIIHAQEGSLEVETGVVLGAGVLVVGAGKIGANACVGSCTTILYSSIDSQQVISPNSLIGDKSRPTQDTTTIRLTARYANEVEAIDESHLLSEVKSDPKPKPPVTPTPEKQDLSVDTEPLEPEKTSDKPPVAEVTSEPQPTPTNVLEVEVPTNASVQVYGQLHLNRLLLTLFPHNQSLKPPDRDGKAE
ncbi:carbon dioxide concentrating mechanism protein [Floridanema evergladense]|uniref:Carbon dioxide concentrating mechanism protein n=1 Tax=Floridaenema evergladense BLCC-F167 TaxID=3153639 RepID=A0ABV4WLV5_9CYAN